jgi:hypothetical protein
MIRSDPIKLGPRLVPAVSSSAQDDAGYGALFQLGLWGGAAAACLLLVAFATRTESGQARMTAAYSALTGAAEAEKRQSAARERELEDARRMTAMIRNLTEDRDRLLVRMTALERNYEDVTGSIGKLANAARPPAAEVAAAAVATMTAPDQPVTVPQQAAAMPVGSAPAANSPAARGPVASAPPAAPAAASATAKTAAPEQQGPVSTRSEFGIDIGGAPTLSELRNVWERASRNHGVLLDGLRPLIAVRDGRAGQVELRLVVGPIGNAAAAAKLCAALAAAGMSCQPTMFDGQRLALR